MGAIYEAQHLRLGRSVAVKVPLEAHADQPEVSEVFQREANLLSQIDHPGVVRALDIDEDERGPFLVLEYLDGETAAERLQRAGRLPVREVVSIVSDVADALDEVHARGIVHCDIKPANVFLVGCRQGSRVKLLDFGISVTTAACADDEQRPRSVAGTPSYMAPEQAYGEDVDHRADQFSLAATAYELLCGRRALCAGGARGFTSLLYTKIEPVSTVAPEVPRALDAVLSKAMSPEAKCRYADIEAFAAAMRSAVDECLESSPYSVAPQSGVRAIARGGAMGEGSPGCSLCG
jgi:serine/threonine-protein kinase